MTIINVRTLLSLIILLFTLPLNAQRSTNCANPTAQMDLDINGVRARITNGGDLWWDGQRGLYEVTAADDSPGVNPVSAIFAGGLWIGGMDPGGGVKVAAQQYGRTVGDFDYYPGPLTDDGVAVEGDCSEWDRLFPVLRTEVRQFLNDFDAGSITSISDVPANIAGWPATGNPHFESLQGFVLPNTSQGLAPFWDEDQDGTYDPLGGDYPLFCGDQAIWCVFNDAGNIHRNSQTPNQVQMEVQLLAYAFASEDSILHRTTFYEYKLINRAQEAIMNMYAGHMIDSDLGCATNDLVNSSPNNNLFYVYNANGIDPESCDFGVAGYDSTAPVNIFQVVAASTDPTTEDPPLMRSVINYYDSELPNINGPSSADQYYNILQGRWVDGTPITRGRLGHMTDGDTTHFVYDGGDYNGTPWWNCSGDNSRIGNVRQVYATGPYTLHPGAETMFTLAVTTIFGVDYPDGNCPDTTAVFDAAKHIKRIYDGNCTASALVGTNVPLSPTSIGLEVFPNPTSGIVSFRLPGNARIDRVEVLDMAGRQLGSWAGAGGQIEVDLKSSGLKAGIYVYRLRTEDGRKVAGRLVLTR